MREWVKSVQVEDLGQLNDEVLSCMTLQSGHFYSARASVPEEAESIRPKEMSLEEIRDLATSAYGQIKAFKEPSAELK